MTTRVLLVDADTPARERLADDLAAGHEITVVGQVSAWGEEARTALGMLPHVVLLDLEMLAHTAVRATRDVVQHWSSPVACMLIASERALAACADDLVSAVQLGARGYLSKDALRPTLRTAVHTLARGGVAISPDFARDLVTAFDHPLLDQIASDQQNLPAAPWPRSALTDAERRTLLLVGLGMEHDEIARRLLISERTVHSHLRTVLDKVRTGPGGLSDPLGSRVPRWPLPPGLAASAAIPVPDADQSNSAYHGHG